MVPYTPHVTSGDERAPRIRGVARNPLQTRSSGSGNVNAFPLQIEKLWARSRLVMFTLFALLLTIGAAAQPAQTIRQMLHST